MKVKKLFEDKVKFEKLCNELEHKYKNWELEELQKEYQKITLNSGRPSGIPKILIRGIAYKLMEIK